jgi:putative salt-induced outer membrane protein YdiY
MVGEVKSMDRGVLSIETDYSDNDFKIEWLEIKEIYTESYFFITSKNGERFSGKLKSDNSGKINILLNGQPTHTLSIAEIVYLKSVDQGFWDQIYAAIDVGFTLTKANNLQQLNMRGNIGYLAERWSADASYNLISSTQDDAEKTRRSDGGFTFRYYLPKDWYLYASFTGLSNTEQKLDLRTNASSGIGKYIIHTNHTYWGFQLGANYNNEIYSGEQEKKNSMEGMIGSELNLYDIGDWSLLTRIVGYPSITESGRWRTDFSFDTKYDLPLDFYAKLGITVNYDNQPAEGASETDYVFITGFGWEW